MKRNVRIYKSIYYYFFIFKEFNNILKFIKSKKFYIESCIDFNVLIFDLEKLSFENFSDVLSETEVS